MDARIGRGRSALLAGCLAVGLALGLPAAASASVGVSPPSARQGDAADLTFRVTEDRPGTWTTTVEIRLPEGTPIAEVYPLSDPDWAPRISYRELSRPVPGSHGSGSTVTSAITWYRSAGARPAGAAANLRVAMAPMPSVARLELTVVQTYSDGAVRRGPLVLPLGPGGAAQGEAAPDAGAPAGQALAVSAADASDPGGGAAGAFVALAGTLALLGGLAVGVARTRRRDPSDEEEPFAAADTESADDVGAARIS